MDGTNQVLQLLTGTAERVRVDSSGNVGVGTSSPGAKLDVRAGTLRLSTDNDRTTVYGVNRGDTGSVNGMASIGLFGSGTNGYLGNIVFNTCGSDVFNDALTERMRIDSSGNVGIGISSPAAKLDVSGTSRIRTDVSTSTVINTITNAAANAYATHRTDANDYQFYTTGSSKMVIDTSGNVGIGTSSPTQKFHVAGSGSTYTRVSSANAGTGAGAYYTNATATWLIGAGPASGGSEFAFVDQTSGSLERMRITSGGEVYIAGTTDQGAYNLQVNGTGVWGAGAYVNGSDIRLKEEVKDLPSAIDIVSSLRPVTFKYKADYSKDTNVQPGFIAQELQAALGETEYVDGVVQAGTKHLNVAYQALIPVLTKAIQELKAELDALKGKTA
jgi:hypothetical protein